MVVRARTKKVAAVKKEQAEKQPAEQGKGKGATGIGVQKVFQLRLDMMVSQGTIYEGESHAEVMAEIERLIKERYPEAIFTPTGGYYLIEGDGTYGQREVCRPSDFDHTTMTRRPGTFPPSWSLTNEMQASVERQLRVLQELTQPPLSRNPGNLPTTKELDRMQDREARNVHLKEVSDRNNAKHSKNPPKTPVVPENAALREVKSVAESAAGKKLTRIAKERPDLIEEAPKPKPTTKRIVRKKAS